MSSATQHPARMKVNTKPRGQALLLWFHTPSFSCPHTSPRPPLQNWLLSNVPVISSVLAHFHTGPSLSQTLLSNSSSRSHTLWVTLTPQSPETSALNLHSTSVCLFDLPLLDLVFLYVLNLVTLKIPEWRTVWTVFHPLYYLEWRPDAMRNTYWATL